jgi:hypothetical protein
VLLRGETPATLFVVLADPPAANVAEFHRWYDEVHGPDALGNGSFVALSRFEAAGPGHVAAPFLAFWEGTFADETSAWTYIRPRAMELRAAGRAGEVAAVSFAIMLVREATGAASRTTEPVRSLVTVQSDWRDPAGAEPVDVWWHRAGLDRAPVDGTAWLVTSDPAARGAGHHLAAFASSRTVEESLAAWAGFETLTPGTSPVPPYTNIFGIPAAPEGPEPDPAAAWVMHWRPITAQRVPGA